MDALVVLVGGGALAGSFFLAHRRWPGYHLGKFGWMVLGFVITLAGYELWSLAVTGKTQSQNFWAFSLAHPWPAIVLAALLGIGLNVVWVHLLWKLLRRWRERLR